MAADLNRTHRVEIYSPAGKWVWGQWVDHRAGSGTYIDRLERAALVSLGSEPAGSKARVFRYAPHSTDHPMTEVLTVSLTLAT